MPCGKIVWIRSLKCIRELRASQEIRLVPERFLEKDGQAKLTAAKIISR